jgi:pimeloyl-ACP methyl ester carboxylesterase
MICLKSAMINRALFLLLLALLAMTISSSTSAVAQAQVIQAKRPLIFVPGLLGSRLCRSNAAKPGAHEEVWGTLGALSQFHSLRLPPTRAAGNDDVRPCGLVREIVYLGFLTQQVYGPVVTHLQSLGYREGRDLFIFDYDWRRSVFENAELLAAFVQQNVPDSSQRIDILAHSMGGLISRVYAVKFGGSARMARLMSAGTPFLGSVKAFETVEKGWSGINYFLGGLTAVRQTILTFPSLFELMPRYAACCDADQAKVSTFAPSEAASWESLRWDGVDVGSMPDLRSTFLRVQELESIVDSALPPDVEDVLIIGVDQRTSQRVAFERGGIRTSLRVQTTWAGDGTVVRESAALPGRTLHSTSFADHQQILHDPQVREFVGVALTRGVPEAMRTVKVRPRSTIRAVDGSPTELVGVAVTTSQPIYRSGDRAQARVHFRLGTQRALSPHLIRLSFRAPDGRETAISLRRDPAASDPTNPFEQTFSGEFVASARSGVGMLTAAVTVDAARPRIVERSVPIVAIY